jgi:hypothetical protein
VTDPGGNTSEYAPAFQGAEAPASIEGQVFQDANANGLQDAGEGGLNGWTVQLLDETNQVVRAVQTQSVDLNGDGQIDPLTEQGIYRFTNLLPLHHYTVREVPQAGAQQTFPAAPGVQVFTPQYGQNITAADFGDVLPSPTVLGVVVNDGAVQRSMVKKVTVTFSTQVTLDPGAFTLLQTQPLASTVTGVGGQSGDVTNLLRVQLAVVNGQTVATLTFAGAGPVGGPVVAGPVGGPVVAGSLPDGTYTLTIHGARVHDAVSGVALDGAGTGKPGSDDVVFFRRLFGDANGDGRVDATDQAAFMLALNSRVGMPNYQDFFDFNGDGVINAVDLFQFQQRLGRRLVGGGPFI